MATSTVARLMAAVLLSAVLLFSIASGQSIQPTNATLPPSEARTTQLNLALGSLTGPSEFNIAPLTESVGRAQSQGSVNQVTPTGDIRQVGPSNENNVTTSDIAYISCDPNTDTSNIDPNAVVSIVGQIRPRAIVLYSIFSANCNLTGEFSYTTMYTMTSASDSRLLLNYVQTAPSTRLQARIGANTTTNQGSSATSNDGGPAPTTAVAMSILYSITGIITLLFLIIIATGAIRAHRHPERYGPRTGLAGRPRQSRAKGLARAMLETLPIVKFGDPEPPKPGSRDIELEDGNTSVHAVHEVANGQETGVTDGSMASATAGNVESGMGPNQTASIKSGEDVAKNEPELGCSICTEDFTTGEDVRVLPCNHKYHPACIDPWLLNVSGTCPLCRHDLRPVTSATDNPTSSTAEGSELPPPLSSNEGADEGAGAMARTSEGHEAADANHQHHRVSRFLDLNRLRHAPPDERIAALRRLREQSQLDGDLAEDVEEHGRRARLTGRLRDTFRIRTRTQAQE